ncbi:mitogen-activated protein kinase kinase kinase 5-like [Rhinatrema bivittatum]|uniref:mitogen-activated protein kinase kinase kinase 5-like n=1 Tax=Rhinatrema bivittatum TaxID=194408 RepID=UPI00112A7631|nr:mitogen-activated protein kinase kinase kinase 5-like [Rhinatrema bivittatum]
MSDSSEGITFSVPGSPGEESGGARPGPAQLPKAGSFWHEDGSGGAVACQAGTGGGIKPKGVGSGAAPGGGGSCSRRTTVAYVINEGSPAGLQACEAAALQCLREACESVAAALEPLHFSKLDFGETGVLDRFYNADIAVVEMSDVLPSAVLFLPPGCERELQHGQQHYPLLCTNS